MKNNEIKDLNSDLSDFEKWVICDKGTEIAFSGEYLYNKRKGTYVCRNCGSPLYRSQDKFESSCGWPSFDDEISGAVARSTDDDGRRTEITCAKCGGHLGHVFTGEGYTPKNTRHCVNSVSMRFVPDNDQQTPTDISPDDEPNYETAVFAGGCFWGVEHLMSQAPGVVSTECGYMGGMLRHPSYREVCTGQTGHAEVIKVVFDPTQTSFETLTKLFFEIHDPTQEGGQGPDMGNQYRSVIFYTDPQQKAVAEKLINELTNKGYHVVTTLEPADTFWKAEEYHQRYYDKTGKTPYCHVYTKRF